MLKLLISKLNVQTKIMESEPNCDNKLYNFKLSLVSHASLKQDQVLITKTKI